MKKAIHEKPNDLPLIQPRHNYLVIYYTIVVFAAGLFLWRAILEIAAKTCSLYTAGSSIA
jgi:hypothetical protein